MNVLPTAMMPIDASLPAEQLRNAVPGSDAAAEAATKLEGVFVSMLLKTMRETMTEGEMFGGDHADIWGGVFDQYMGDEIAGQGGLGITDQLSLGDATRVGTQLSFVS